MLAEWTEACATTDLISQTNIRDSSSLEPVFAQSGLCVLLTNRVLKSLLWSIEGSIDKLTRLGR